MANGASGWRDDKRRHAPGCHIGRFSASKSSWQGRAACLRSSRGGSGQRKRPEIPRAIRPKFSNSGRKLGDSDAVDNRIEQPPHELIVLRPVKNSLIEVITGEVAPVLDTAIKPRQHLLLAGRITRPAECKYRTRLNELIKIAVHSAIVTYEI